MILYYCEDDNLVPERQHETDAGLDLKASEELALLPEVTCLMNTGVKVEIPPGYVGLVFPRSGLASKKGIVLANTVGVIDSDYRGYIMCAVRNTSNVPYTIKKYERIAQLVVVPCLVGTPYRVYHEDELTNTERGEGGFGHTGS